MTRTALHALDPVRATAVSAPDGVQVVAYEWGERGRPELLLVHPWSASHLSWFKQVRALAGEFHVVAYDIRGHGYSDKPKGREYYVESRRYADELRALLDAVGLRRPVAVGASTGGRVINDYLLAYGPERLAGVVYSATSIKADPAMFGAARLTMPPMMKGENLFRDVQSALAFIDVLTHKRLPPEEAQLVLAFMMLAPPFVRDYVFHRDPTPYEPMLRALPLPALVTHGAHDDFLLLPGARYMAEIIPNARLSTYEDAGHATYLEEPDRFNRELADFARAAHGL